MYTIKCDGKYLHNADIGLVVINGNCKMEINKTGSLTFYIAKNHPNISTIKKLSSEIILYQDNKAIFYGRPLNTSFDIDGLMYVECEGELAYLLDSVRRRKTEVFQGTADTVLTGLWMSVLREHWDQMVDKNKAFNVGKVTVKDSNGYIRSVSNYEKTLDYINEKVIKRFGGYMKITRDEDGKKRLNYLAEPEVNLEQTIELGKNIVSLEQNIKGDTVYTALIPLGSKIESESSSNDERRLTISSLPNETDGTIVKQGDRIYDTEAVEKYGLIYAVETWDDVSVAENLLKKAKERLKQNKKESVYLELTAIDLHNVDVSIDSLEVGEKVHCISKYHDIDEWMIIKSIDIDIDNPANSFIRLVENIDIDYNDESLTEQRNDDKKENDEKNNTIDDKVPTDEDLYNQINDLKEWCNDTFYPKDGDLSAYAKIVDVNNAFNQLATALEGV